MARHLRTQRPGIRHLIGAFLAITALSAAAGTLALAALLCTIIAGTHAVVCITTGGCQ